MSRPKLLDLFCCAGGAGMGYYRSGFDVTGVDVSPQPNYPLEFVQGDAIHYLAEHWSEYDAVHASPPCQRYAGVTAWRGNQDEHPDLVGVTRSLLDLTGLPWVMENVPEAPMRRDLLLCGSMFGLKVRRHRAFESNQFLMMPQTPCHHVGLLPFMHKGERAYADALGCQWMTNREGRQAIPPAYTEHIGTQLLAHVEARAAR